MGLFDKILKEGADILKEVATEENKEKAASLLNSLKESLEEHAGEIKNVIGELADEAKVSTGDPSLYEEVEDGKTCRQRILEALASEFPDYTVKENVSPRDLGGTGAFMDYSILVCKDEEVKLVIMLIGKTTTAHREYRFSKQFAQTKGYPFINFIEHYPNQPDYIVQRLHKYL